MDHFQEKEQRNPQVLDQTSHHPVKKSKFKIDLKLFAGILLIILLPVLLIAAVFGNKIVRTDLGANTSTKAAGDDPKVMGQWSAVTQLPVKATHTALLPTGKVITWPSKEGDQPYIWDPITNTSAAAPKAGYNIFCAGLTLTADGKLFVPGGHIKTPIGLPHASFYDPITNSWTRVKDMNNKRWYPTVTTLTNGDLLTTSGTIERGVYNEIPQVYNIRNNTWRTLSTARLKQTLYPFMYQTSSGKVFMAGNTRNTRFLDTTGTGKWGSAIKTNFGARGAGTSVMYADNKILIAGGANTKTAEIIDLDETNPKWKYTGSMSQPRTHTNTTILPDGKVLITGGTYGTDDDATKPVLAAEIWSSSTGQWTKVASNTVYRGYHSTALLLPDGRVFSGGGEKSETSMEIYSPPYLFKGARPTITAAPTNVDYGQKFLVKTPDASKITKVTWLRLGAVTHSFNQSQRYNSLTFTKKTNGVEVVAKTNQGQTPPGHYMLFILNEKQVPSVAKIIKVGSINITLPPTLPSLTPTPTPTPGGTTTQEDHRDHEIILEEFKEDPNI